MPFSCDTNCTWEEPYYFSLGIRSQCVNVTTQTLATGIHLPPNFTYGQDPPWVGHNVVMTTPSNLTMHYNSSSEYYRVIYIVGKPQYKQMKYMQNKPDNPIPPEGPYPSRFALIGVMRMINVDYLAVMRKLPNYPPEWYQLGTNITEIFECSLDFVANKYSGIESKGNNFFINKTKVIALSPGHHTMYDNSSGSTLLANFETPGLPIFNVSLPDLGALDALFTGPRFSGGTFDGQRAPPASGLGVALKNANVTATFEQVARSMTHQLHSNYKESKSNSARSSERVVLVSVVWWWLSAPVLVHLSALLLLVRTMSHSSASEPELWKSSPAALLYHEIVPGHGSEQTLRTDIQDVKRLKELAESVRISYMK